MTGLRLICASLVLVALPHASAAQINFDQVLRRGMDILQQQTAPPRQPAPAPAPSPPPQRQQQTQPPTGNSDRPALSGQLRPEELQEVQRLLAWLGYYDGIADGRMGPQTMHAVSEFRRLRGMPHGAIPDRAFLAVLREAAMKGESKEVTVAARGKAATTRGETASAQPPDPSGTAPLKPDQLGEAQTLLRQLGYYGGPIDKRLNRETMAAIADFREAQGMRRSGIPDRNLLASLRTAVADGAATAPAPAPAITGQPAPADIVQAQRPRSPMTPLTPDELAEAQARLRQLGYYGGPGDRRLNPATVAAIAAFRKDHGIPPGLADQQLLQALRSVAAGAPAEPAPPPVEIADDFDPLAPEGVVPGMQMAEAGETLKRRGYRQDGYRYIARSGTTEVLIMLHPGGTSSTAALRTIGRVDYQRSERKTTASAVELAKRISAALGVQPHCNKLMKYLGDCVWNTPDGASRIAHVELRFNQNSKDTDIFLGLSGAEPSRSRPVPQAAAPAAPNTAAPPDAATSGTAALATELDPLAPAGVSVGMEAADALRALAAAGFGEQRDKSFVRKEGTSERTVRVYTGNHDLTSRDGPITFVEYMHKDRDTALSGPRLVEALSAKLGAQPTCSALKKEIAICQWREPAQAPLVQGIQVRYKQDRLGSETRLDLWPVASLMKARPAPPAAKPLLTDLDPLAPDGAAIGMKAADIGKALAAKGYKARGFCDHVREGDGRRLVRFKTLTHCANQEAVSSIDYQADDVRIEGSLRQFLERLNEKAGAAAKCQGMWEDSFACTWHTPPRAPLVQKAVVRATKTSVQVLLEAIPDLPARAALVPMDKQPWWVQEIAKADARTEKFSDSDSFALLPEDEQKPYGDEAAYVFDYCRKREVFAYLHDCRCVAGKVLDARVEQEAELLKTPALARSIGPRTLESREFQTRLIAMGDKVADRCPSKAGAAAYAFKQCRSLYAASMAEGLDPYCTCYADGVAEGYMREPRSDMTHMKNLGVAAIRECKRRGFAGPSRL